MFQTLLGVLTAFGILSMRRLTFAPSKTPAVARRVRVDLLRECGLGAHEVREVDAHERVLDLPPRSFFYQALSS